MQREWYSFREEYLAEVPGASFKQLSAAWHKHKARQRNAPSLTDLPLELLEQIAGYDVRGNTSRLQRVSKYTSVASARKLAELCVAPESHDVLLATLRKVQPEVSAILRSSAVHGGDLVLYGGGIKSSNLFIKVRLAEDGWTTTKPSKVRQRNYALGDEPDAFIDPRTQKELLHILRPSCVAVYPNFADNIVKKSVLEVAKHYLEPFVATTEDIEQLLTGKIRPLYLFEAGDTSYSLYKLQTYQEHYMRLLLFEAWLQLESMFEHSAYPEVLPPIVRSMRGYTTNQTSIEWRKRVYVGIIALIETSLVRIRNTYLELFPIE